MQRECVVCGRKPCSWLYRSGGALVPVCSLRCRHQLSARNRSQRETIDGCRAHVNHLRKAIHDNDPAAIERCRVALERWLKNHPDEATDDDTNAGESQCKRSIYGG